MMRTKKADGCMNRGIGCTVAVGWPGEESNGFYNVGTEQIEWLVGKVSYNLRSFAVKCL